MYPYMSYPCGYDMTNHFFIPTTDKCLSVPSRNEKVIGHPNNSF